MNILLKSCLYFHGRQFLTFTPLSSCFLNCEKPSHSFSCLHQCKLCSSEWQLVSAHWFLSSSTSFPFLSYQPVAIWFNICTLIIKKKSNLHLLPQIIILYTDWGCSNEPVLRGQLMNINSPILQVFCQGQWERGAGSEVAP